MIESFKIPSATFPTLTGSIVTFNSQYADLHLKSHKVSIDSVSGVSAINVSATSKNLFNINALIPNKGLDVTTGEEISQSSTKITPFIPVSAGAYYWNGNSTRPYFYDSNKAFIERGNYLINDNTFTVNEGVGYVRFQASNANWNIPDLQLEKGSTATAYDPFGTYTTINIGQTVNEGEYDSRTGILEVTLPSVQTIQLPPCPIDTLEGVNNIWADTGETTLQYPKFG